jgi:outer membrane protein assembly factor BamB
MPASEDGYASDLLITNWMPSRDTDTYYVSYTSKAGRNRKVLWEKELPEADGWYSPQAAFDEQHVYYVSGDRLFAWDRARGKETWEALLSDVVQYGCANCIERAQSKVVVLTEDYVLQAVDAQSGQEAWTIRLNNRMAARNGFHVVGDQIVLLDDMTPDGHDPAVHYYDIDDGRLARQLVSECPDEDEIPRITGDEVFFSAREDRVYIYYDCGWVPYVEAWDLARASLAWRAALPESMHGVNTAMIGQRALYLESYDSLYAVSLDDGEARFLVDQVDPDYDVLLLAERGDMLVARAKRTRGSTRYELWGLDLSGERLWQHPIQADTLHGVESGSGDWGYHFADDLLIVFQVLDDGEKDLLLVETLDAATGQVVRESTSEIDYDTLDGIAWGQQSGFLTVGGRAYAVDLVSGEVELEWP